MSPRLCTLHKMGGTGSYRPWRDLRSRADVEFEAVDLPDGMRALWARDPVTGARAILVNRKLPPEERLFALAHELVHDERGGSGDHPDLPPLLAPMVAREEAHTDRVAARRILPAALLAEWVDVEVGLGNQVTVGRVQEHFGVARTVAASMLEDLRRSA